MHPSLRDPLINRLVNALATIGLGPTFERFGGKLMDHYLGVPLSHRGLNILGVPVPRELDTRDDGGRYVAEYSAEKDYFNTAMTKPEHDLGHALTTQPGAEHIFLLSSRAAPDGRIAAFLNKKKGVRALKGKTIHLWDARRIATVIIDDLLVSNTAIDALAEFLPELGQIRDELAASHTAPTADPKQIPRREVEAELDRRLAFGRLLAIWGMGGAGKSNATVALVTRMSAQFELSIWFKRGDIRSVEDLNAVPLVRGGEARNVANLLKTRSCLVVLDDIGPDIEISRLAALCGPRSKIIVTSRHEIADGYPLPMMTKGEARTLLDQDVDVPCPDACFDTICGTVGGHPLSLSLLNKAVLEGATWDEVTADCTAIGELEAGDQRLADRILGRLHTVLGRELSLFAWAGQARCDRRFLEVALKPMGRRKVMHHGLTTVDDAHTVRLHDIVFASVQAQDWLTAERAHVFDEEFAGHIRVLYHAEALELVALATTMKAKLEALVRSGDTHPEFLLALLKIWEPDQLDPTLLPDPLEAAAELADAKIDMTPLALSVVLETIEGLWRHEAATLGPPAAKERYRTRIAAFEILRANPHATDRQRAEIDHHHAKALNLLGERAAARILFESVQAGPSPLAATSLQLIRIYARIKDMAEEAARLAGGILSAPPGTVSATVTLAVIEALPWTSGNWQGSLMGTHADIIERTIVEAAAVGLDQAYLALASVGRYWVWHDKERLLRVYFAIPRSPAAISTDQNRFAYGEILRLIGRATGEATFRDQALEAFALLDMPDTFQRQQYAQLLLDMDRAGEAEAVLRTIETPTPWSNYYLSRAMLAQGRAGEALPLATASLDALESATERFRSSFLAHRYEVRRALGDPQAVDDLDSAIASCSDAKFKRALEARRQAA